MSFALVEFRKFSKILEMVTTGSSIEDDGCDDERLSSISSPHYYCSERGHHRSPFFI